MYHLITSPQSLTDLFSQGSEAGVSLEDIKNAAELATHDERAYPRSSAGLVYHPESMGLKKVTSMLQQSSLPDEVPNRMVCEMVLYWWSQYRNVMAETLRQDERSIIQAEDLNYRTKRANQFIPVRGSTVGYKLQRPKRNETNLAHTCKYIPSGASPRDFRGVHPCLMPERIDFIDRPVAKTNITFAPFLRSRGEFFEVFSRLPYREKVAYLLDIGLAINALHESGYLHLDIKPDNIIFDLSGSMPLVYVADLEGAHRPEDLEFAAMSPMFSPLAYFHDWLNQMKYGSELDAFSFAHLVVAGLCGSNVHESLVDQMYTHGYEFPDSQKLSAFFDDFFSDMKNQNDEIISDHLKGVLRKILSWRKSEIPLVGDLCVALSEESGVNIIKTSNGKLIADHVSPQG